MRILNCYMANDSKGHFVTAKEAAKHNRQDVLCCVSCGCPLTLQRGNDGQPPWFEHDQMTVAEKILLRCTWLDPAEKEARRLHLQGMTVPDYTVKVRKWFCVMCDEDYEGEKCCPRCGTGSGKKRDVSPCARSIVPAKSFLSTSVVLRFLLLIRTPVRYAAWQSSWP